MTPAAFYLPVSDGIYDSTSATTSPWDGQQQHGGPPSALLARTIQACTPRPDMAVSRISIDFLGPIPQGRMEVSAEVLRPGRRVELVEARLDVAGRRVAVARAWLGQVDVDTAPAVPTDPPPVPARPGPQEQAYFPGVDPEWGYGRAIEWRFVRGSYLELGPAVVWARPLLPLVAGEPMTGLQRTLLVADSINGISCELDLTEWLFIPPGLTFTGYRESDSEWVLLDATTLVDPRGAGLAHATVFDPEGQIGVATQPLLVQRRPS